VLFRSSQLLELCFNELSTCKHLYLCLQNPLGGFCTDKNRATVDLKEPSNEPHPDRVAVVVLAAEESTGRR
jgi:hypothetical protein